MRASSSLSFDSYTHIVIRIIRLSTRSSARLPVRSVRPQEALYVRPAQASDTKGQRGDPVYGLVLKSLGTGDAIEGDSGSETDETTQSILVELTTDFP